MKEFGGVSGLGFRIKPLQRLGGGGGVTLGGSFFTCAQKRESIIWGLRRGPRALTLLNHPSRFSARQNKHPKPLAPEVCVDSKSLK